MDDVNLNIEVVLLGGDLHIVRLLYGAAWGSKRECIKMFVVVSEKMPRL
jgi:hypothetical protein